jgi:hypothetical protein
MLGHPACREVDIAQNHRVAQQPRRGCAVRVVGDLEEDSFATCLPTSLLAVRDRFAARDEPDRLELPEPFLVVSGSA